MIYKAVFHIDMDDEKAFGIGLVNVTNLLKAIPGKPFDLVVVFNGPAVNLLIEENCVSQADTIKQLQEQKVKFSVCNNALTHFGVKPEELVKNCNVVPAGIVSLIELQNEGYAYIKP